MGLPRAYLDDVRRELVGEADRLVRRDWTLNATASAQRLSANAQSPSSRQVRSRLLEDSHRAGVGPDSVQALDGTLSSRLPTRLRVWLYSVCVPVGRRGGAWPKRVCPARSSNARLAVLSLQESRVRMCMKIVIGVDPHKLTVPSRSSTTTSRCWPRAGAPPTTPAMPRCASTSRPGRNGPGRAGAAAGAGGPLAQRLLGTRRCPRGSDGCWLTVPHAGTWTVTRVPAPRRLVSCSVPPTSSARSRMPTSPSLPAAGSVQVLRDLDSHIRRR